MEITLIIWCIFGIASAMLAKRKARNGCGFFLAGVALGPFGLLLAALAAPNTARLARRAIRSGRLKPCPQCAELLPSAAIRCRHCGADCG